VAERAGRNLIDCSLELGGNNPIVLDDTDVDEAARGAVQACFSNAGQLCLSAERIYVVESAYDEFVDAFVRETERLTLGTGYDYDAESARSSSTPPSSIGSRTTSTTRGSARATVLTGGRARPNVAPYCYEPTILTDVEPDATVACETFGPVVSVAPVPAADAAVAAANDSPYGLNASVWTRDRDRGAEIARDIDCGTVNVNDAFLATWGAVDAPMGGFGDSGMGRRHPRGDPAVRRVPDDRGLARRSPHLPGPNPDRLVRPRRVRGALARAAGEPRRAAAERADSAAIAHK